MTRRRFGARRLWIVNHHADTPDHAAGCRHFDYGRRLVERGWDVTIFAASFSHGSGRDERLAGRRLTAERTVEGVRFVWLRTFPYRGNTWRRVVNMITFAAAFLLVQTRHRRPDVVIGSTVHPFAAFAAWLAARTRGARYVFEIRDLWPQTLVDLGALRSGSPAERLFRWIEAFLVRRAVVVIALLPGVADYLGERGLPADHVVYLPNGVDLVRFDGPDPAPDEAGAALAAGLAEVARMRAEGRLVLGYLGALGRVNAVDVVIRAGALAEAARPGAIGLLIVGSGPEYRPLLALAARGRASVAFSAPIPRRHVPRLLRSLDAGVVHATATPVYRYGISFNKLFEYLAARLPVVFACGSAYDPVAASGAGLTVRPDDPAALARVMVELAAMPVAERATMGAAGRAWVANRHDIAVLAERLGRVLELVADGSGRALDVPADLAGRGAGWRAEAVR